MALALPLAILNEAGSNTSIARFTSGNVTPPKTLRTLGDSEFGSGARPHAMSEWVGLTDANNASVCCYSTVGSTFSCCDCKYGCMIYDPALGGTQTYCGCFCWCIEVSRQTSGIACHCLYMRCNGVTKMNCYLTRSSNGATICSGFVNIGPIDSNDTVCLVSFARSTYGGGGGYAYSAGMACLHAVFGNVNGTVAPASPCYNCTLAIASY